MSFACLATNLCISVAWKVGCGNSTVLYTEACVMKLVILFKRGNGGGRRKIAVKTNRDMKTSWKLVCRVRHDPRYRTVRHIHRRSGWEFWKLRWFLLSSGLEWRESNCGVAFFISRLQSGELERFGHKRSWTNGNCLIALRTTMGNLSHPRFEPRTSRAISTD
jgi:hypothetical protein